MTNGRPRILLVPSLTELEWTIKPLLEEWADVASYDAPGIGEESPAQGLLTQAVAGRGVEEIARLGWDDCVVAGDEFGSLAAALIAQAQPEAMAGLALGHATASYRRTGSRPAVNPAVTAGLAQLAEMDFRSFIRQEFRAWHGLRDALEDAPEPDEMAEEYLERVPHEKATAFHRELLENEDRLEALVTEALSGLSTPLLLTRHEGCLMFTKEGYDDIVARLPGATTAVTEAKPTVDPAFAVILRDFCAKVAGTAPRRA